LYRQSLQHKAYYHLSSPVKKIAWKPGAVEATTASGQAYTAKKIIVTLPPPVLGAKDTEAALSFEPQLTEQMDAFKMLGTGPVIKVLINFTHAFWNEQFNQQDLGFLFSDEEIPTWWTQHPQPSPLLAGWCAGPCAHKLKHLTPPQLFQKAMISLARIFNLPQAEIEQNSTCLEGMQLGRRPVYRRRLFVHYHHHKTSIGCPAAARSRYHLFCRRSVVRQH
jgi:monoamine oxidase